MFYLFIIIIIACVCDHDIATIIIYKYNNNNNGLSHKLHNINNISYIVYNVTIKLTNQRISARANVKLADSCVHINSRGVETTSIYLQISIWQMKI